MSAERVAPEVEVKVAAISAALAEAGYPDVVKPDSTVSARDVPKSVIWRAMAITSYTRICWPCFDALGQGSMVCDHDWRSEPWPEVVR